LSFLFFSLSDRYTFARSPPGVSRPGDNNPPGVSQPGDNNPPGVSQPGDNSQKNSTRLSLRPVVRAQPATIYGILFGVAASARCLLCALAVGRARAVFSILPPAGRTARLAAIY